jgi:hypothetical protein
MTILSVPDVVVVLMRDGAPFSLTWEDVRYRVTDTPTPIRGSVLHDLLTHPLEPVIGWRFQGTSAVGETHVFDVHGGDRREWRLVAVYD